MPIYEYRCNSCGRKSTFFIRNIHNPGKLECQKCGSEDLRRLFSRFATLRSEEARLEALADPSRLSGLDENDPASIARWMKKMGKEMGEEVGDDFDQMVEEAVESGELTPDPRESDAEDL
ncbi:MAG TPA: FmdB family zinc ribbon protein [Candidatus Limnocylindrales bacterium]|nr:FmdB family zinc ribbon protein [Candidatus Limnocylindrales bacterium]